MFIQKICYRQAFISCQLIENIFQLIADPDSAIVLLEISSSLEFFGIHISSFGCCVLNEQGDVAPSGVRVVTGL